MEHEHFEENIQPTQGVISDRIRLYQLPSDSDVQTLQPTELIEKQENNEEGEEENEYIEAFMGLDEIASKMGFSKGNEIVQRDIDTYQWANEIDGPGGLELVQGEGDDNAHVLFKGSDSFANYQMGTVLKGSMEREARAVENKEKEENNYQIEAQEEIGEVVEWTEKSANIRKKSQDDNDDSAEFEGIFPEGTGGEEKPQEEELKRVEVNRQGKNATVDEISRKYNNMQMMMNTHNTEIINMLIDIAENGLEGDQDLASMMEQIYQAEGAIDNQEAGVINEEPQDQRVMNQEEFEALFMKSQLEAAAMTKNDENKEKQIVEESPLSSPDIQVQVVNQASTISKDDWEAISKNNLPNIIQKPEKDIHIPDNDPIITFEEVWGIIQHMDLREPKRQILNEINESQGFFRKLLSAMNSLPENLIEERNTFLSLAKIPFNDQEPLHFKILCAIYRELTGKSGIIGRYGEHWEEIGFQGTDPATDLRGAGILGLLQLLALVDQHKELAREMWEHSRHPTYHFPFAVCGLNMTQIVKELLREGKIDDLIMQDKKVVKVCNELYISVFYKLYDIYKSKNCTIHEYSSVQKEVREIVRDDSYAIMEDFRVNRFLLE